MKLSTLILPILAFASFAMANDLDILRGSTTNRESNRDRVRPGSAQDIELKVNETLKRKCNDNGCVIFVNDGSGNEFKVTASVGEGANYGLGGGGGGINIYNSGSGEYYGLVGSFTHSNFTCKFSIPEAAARYMEFYISLVSTPAYANEVLRKAKIGEDMPVPEHVKLAFMLLVSLKTSNQSNCGVSSNNGRY